MTGADRVIVVEGLVKRYGDTVAVDGVSFGVGRGEVLALLGPNGAGKTTTVETLTGFLTRDGGSVRVLGLDPADREDRRRLRSRVGIVLQETGGNYRFLSVRETIEMHRGYHSNPRGVDETLALVELGEAADRRVRELSGGQQRRLDVALALVGRPDLIFLDEPTTGFDPAARRRTWRTIEGLAELGVTVLLTTHYMEEAQRLAHRVAVIQRGLIVGDGTPEELATRLRLGSTLRFRLPEGVGVDNLPERARAADVRGRGDGSVEIRCEDPTVVLADLCGWAVERGHRLEQLEVRPPSLEDSYLTLIESEDLA